MLFQWFLHHGGDDQWLAVAAPYRAHQIAVHFTDELQRYLLGADCFTFTMVRATAEPFIGHCDHHAESPLVALGLTLRQRIQMGKLRRSEEHRRCIRARRDARPTADARS